jgi:sulfur carrier protein
LLHGGTIAVPPKARLPGIGEAAFSMPPSRFAIQLNGEEYTVDGDPSLPALLERLKMRRGRVAVEINQAVVPRAHYDAVRLNPGDIVEVINFVGGG